MPEPLLDGRPRQRPGTRVAVRDGQAVIEAVEDGPLCVLNATATALWELCDGVTTVAEMVGAVCQLWDTSQEEVVPEVIAVLRALEDTGAMVWS